jgi:hypothetical protein
VLFNSEDSFDFFVWMTCLLKSPTITVLGLSVFLSPVVYWSWVHQHWGI